MSDEIYQTMIQPRGQTYRSDQIKPYSHYREPIDHSAGRLAGNSRVWGDASPEVQSRSIDILIEASQRAGLNPRDTAHVLAIARAESGFNPDAASNESAAGLGQFLNRTGRGYGLGNDNRFDARENARALVEHFIDNRDLARRRGQDESYIYKYHHDGPVADSGGLQLSRRNIMPHLDEYERFVQQRLSQTQTTPGQEQTAPQRQQTPTTPATPTPAQPQTQTETQRTTFQQTMERMLPPQNGVHAHVTGHYGEHRGARPGVPAHGHGGTDFNYVGGQSGINMRHPTVHSPVAGTVVAPIGGNFNTVSIRDAQGNVHQVLHMDSRQVRVGQELQAGDPIGTMGNHGPPGSRYAQHVHYQVRDPSGRTVNPETFWNNRAVEAPGRTEGGRTEGGGARTGAGNGGSAIADGVLKPGERGDDVLGLQRNLNLLGVRDANNRPLAEDGNYGDRTREAITAYQQQNRLRVDGEAGPETLGSIGNRLPAGRVTAEARVDGPVGIASPNHPDNALYTAIRSRLPADVPDNVAAKATLQAKENGIDTAAKLKDVTVQDGNAFLTGTTPGYRTKVDLAEPAPSMDQVNAQLQPKPAAQTVPDPEQPQVTMGGR